MVVVLSAKPFFTYFAIHMPVMKLGSLTTTNWLFTNNDILESTHSLGMRQNT